MPPRRSKRRGKPTTRAAARAEAAKTSDEDDKENVTSETADVMASAKDREAPPAVETTLRDDFDEITTVNSKPKPATTHDKLTPLFDEEDEITPVQSVPKTTAKPSDATEYDIGDIDEITSVDQMAPLASPKCGGEEAVLSGSAPHRPPLGVLQASQQATFRPKKVTYGKRRRVRQVEIPTSRALGVMRYSSPEKPASDDGGSSEPQEEDFHESEDDNQEVELPEECSKGLQQFLKQQRALWAEVDAVDLEEELD